MYQQLFLPLAIIQIFSAFFAINTANAAVTEKTMRPPIPPNHYSDSYREPRLGLTKKSILTTGENRSYYLHTPSTRGGKPAPLIILLHGADRTGASMIDTWQHIANEHGIILAAPNSQKKSWDLNTEKIQFIWDVVQEVKATHSVDARRVYLFGHSSGAVYALYLTLLDAQRTEPFFAATTIHAGMLRNRPTALLDALSPGSRIPIGIFNGTKDELFPLDKVKQTANLLDQHGFPTTLFTLRRHTHWYYDIASTLNARAWKFMRSQW